MKKLLFIVITSFLFYSCGSSKVCGGPGGKRCVQIDKKNTMEKIS